MNPLLFPGLKVAALVAVLAGVFAWHMHQVHVAVETAVQIENAKITALWDADRARTAAAAIAAAAAYAAETDRRLTAQKEATNAAEKRAAQAHADALHSADALAGLRHALTTLTAHTAGSGDVPSNPATAGNSSLAAQVGNVLAACAAEYRELAIDADDDRTRGVESNTDYDALSK
jgi:hypothetical protein